MNKKRVISATLLGGLMLFMLGGEPPRARAADREFAPIIKEFKLQYKAKHRKIPFMGLANFAVKIIRPAGVKSLKLEIFEDLQFDSAPDNYAMSLFIRNTLGPEWRPFVRVSSRAGREQTHIYVKEVERSKDVKLMIVTIDESEAVVLRVKVNPQTLAKWMERPKIMGVSLIPKQSPKASAPNITAKAER